MIKLKVSDNSSRKHFEKINEYEYLILKYRKSSKAVTEYIGSVYKFELDKQKKEIDKTNELRCVLGRI
jgi:hypothetical protein